jgi:tRNA(Ile)-lysidine synthase
VIQGNCNRTGEAVSRVVEAIRAFPGLSGPGIVAVSGGADSVALLRGLHEAGAGPLTVAHFNLHLRGAESDADAEFVREQAAGLGLSFQLGEADVRAIAAGDNLEATARRLRYDWLAGVGAGWVATGHTADDQAETVLHRIIRGTGVQGLRGIAPSRELVPGVRLVRPLLDVTRADVLDYLTDLGQPYRDDSSNADRRFTRNRIRHELLPLLKTFSPAIVDVLGRLAEQSGSAATALGWVASELLDRYELPPAGDILVLDAAPFDPPTDLTALVPPYLLREMFRAIWERKYWPTGGMTADHWDRLLAVARGDPSSADFPGGVHVRRVGRVVQLGRSE